MVTLTLFNPDVYLDTVILIGSVSLKFNGFFKLTYLLGAFFGSFVFFLAIAY
jgi:L-lysine exporter family protein LysE/ArgO